MANVLTHAHFQRPLIVTKRRRGRLPRNVVSIHGVLRIKCGVVAEIASSKITANIGARVLVVSYETNGWWHVKSLDRDLCFEDGESSRIGSCRESQLRRCWTGRGVS